MEVHEDGTITGMTELEELEFKFWEEYHDLPETPDAREFAALSENDQTSVMKKRAAELHIIHKRYKTHLWMPSMMKKREQV